jgi:hypothetical protein
MTVEDYLKKIKSIEGILFGRGSRGVQFHMTIYNIHSDLWVNIDIVFEYGDKD